MARARPRDINLNVATSDEVGEAPLYEIAGFPGLSTLQREEAERAAKRHGASTIEHRVRVTTLAAICEEHGVEGYEFLKIDVEGHEHAVLSGAELTRHRPKLLLVESTEPESPREVHHLWEPIVIEAGYIFAFFDGLNRYYVATECVDRIGRVQVPANPLDQFTTPSLLLLKEPEFRLAKRLRKFLLRHRRLRRTLFRRLKESPPPA